MLESSVSYASPNLSGGQGRAELIPRLVSRGVDEAIVFSTSVGVLDLFGSQLVGSQNGLEFS